MSDREWQIGLFGTFDVRNYGDLLFPLIAQAELAERLGRVKIHPFSYHAKAPPDWPYIVSSLAELPEMAGDLDAALIGGGYLVRFDKGVAYGYRPPTSAIHHPTGYWLTPALIALQQGIPLIWNAPGMHCNEIPGWADPLMELTFSLSRYIAVRDELTRESLSRFAGKNQITVMPDTCFGISRLLNGRRPTPEFARLRKASGLPEQYIIVQAALGLDRFFRFVRTHSRDLRDYQILALPVGPVLGDSEELVDCELPGLVRLRRWPQPLLLAELISHAAAVVGHSYHLAITALAFGVPVFTSADLSVGKYTALARFDNIYPIPVESDGDPGRFVARLGKTEPSMAARAAVDQLNDHWDRIATIIGEGATGTQPAVNRFWQSVPNILEAASRHPDKSGSPELWNGVDARDDALALILADIVARDNRIAAIYSSPSWRVTAPLRFLMRGLKRLARR